MVGSVESSIFMDREPGDVSDDVIDDFDIDYTIRFLIFLCHCLYLQLTLSLTADENGSYAFPPVLWRKHLCI